MRGLCLIGILVAAELAAAADTSPPMGDATPTIGAGLSLPGITLVPGMALSGWKFRRATAGSDCDSDGWRTFLMRTGKDNDDPLVNGRARFLAALPDAVRAEWSIVPSADASPVETFISGNLAGGVIAGGHVDIDGNTVPTVLDGAKAHLFRDVATTMSFFDRDGAERLRVSFDSPTRVLLQDSAHWGQNYLTIRIFFAEGPIVGGREYAIAATISTPKPFGIGDPRTGLALFEGGTVRIEAGPDWIPVVGGAIEPGSALDFSVLRPSGKPVGRYGRVIARNGHFEFEGRPGVAQRFYGANLCFGANFPKTAEEAHALARTLASVGYNAIRIHHHDSLCIDRNDPQGVRLDEAMMRRMDFLVAACADEGLYISTDLFVSRTLKPISWRTIGVERDGNLSMVDMKVCAPVHDGVQSNFLAFAENWLCRVNTVTGRRYADDPAIAWISLVNEGNLDTFSGADFASRPGWREEWGEWLAQRKRENPDVWSDIPEEFPEAPGGSRHGRAFLLFLQDVETRFIARTRQFLDRIGCRSLVTDMNNFNKMTAALEKVRAESCDYIDTHFYIDHPQFLGKGWERPSRCPNENPFRTRQAGAAPVAAVRVFGKPFTVSEYNYSGPGRYRGAGGIAVGAEAALQDWAGLWRFAWSHDLQGALEPCSRHADYFDIASDPLLLASERAGICLFLRGDMTPLERACAVTLPHDRISSIDASIDVGPGVGLSWIGWLVRFGTANGSKPPPGAIHAGDFDTAYVKPRDEVRRELGSSPASCVAGGFVSVSNGVFLVNTPCTAGGFAEGGRHVVGPLDFSLEMAPATLWISSLDGYPIATASHLLLTHLTDVQNNGAEYADPALTTLLDWGGLPHLMHHGEAHVSLRLEPGAAPTVFALSPSGHRLGTIPASWNPQTGRLSFAADTALHPEAATFLYEIVRHRP